MRTTTKTLLLLSERSTYQWEWFPWNSLNSALYVTIEAELLKPFLIKLHLISEIAIALSQFCTAIFIVATWIVHERQNAVISKWRHIKSRKIWPPSQFFSGYALVVWRIYCIASRFIPTNSKTGRGNFFIRVLKQHNSLQTKFYDKFTFSTSKLVKSARGRHSTYFP